MWFYLILRRPDLESSEGTTTPLGHVIGWVRDVEIAPLIAWVPTYLMVLLPALGLMMVGRIRYVHVASRITHGRSHFFTLVKVAASAILFYLAPVPALFIVFNGFVLYGLFGTLMSRSRATSGAEERPA